MRKFLCGVAAALSVSPALHAEAPATPAAIVAAAPVADWVRIAPADLVVMELAPGGQGASRRVVIQLVPPPFSQGWVENIRKLVAARWYDGNAVVRVQDNYVVQWGDPEGEIAGRAKPLPPGLRTMTEDEYIAPVRAVAGEAGGKDRASPPMEVPPALGRGLDPYVRGDAGGIPGGRHGVTGFSTGWPMAMLPLTPRGPGEAWPLHCYGMVGVGRNVSPDTGSGAELYVVIGQAPRQLDRNIAVVGRVIEGIEYLSSLPRGTGELGFYRTAAERTPILSVRMGSEVAGLPTYEYLSTGSDSFAAFADKRANRKDAFYIRPAGGVDVCNVPVPIRAATR